MKSILIKNVTPFAGGVWQKEQDILIKSEEAIEIDGKGLLALPALYAIGADFQEPVRDDVYSFADGIEAMRRGGFYGCLYESKANPIDDLQQLESFKQLGQKSGFDISFLASFSRANGHKNISEMLELANGGAFGFGDGGITVGNLRFLRLIFEYGRATGKTLFLHSLEPDLSLGGFAHEGLYSDMLGLKGIPEMAETIVVYRILEFSIWFKVPVHFRGISCGKSLELIETAKKRGAEVSCDVDIYHLLFDDSSLENLSSEYRFISPLRTVKDKEALWAGLLNGIVKNISCNHFPVLKQEKQTNFEDATPGAVSLEVALSALWCKIEPQKLLSWLNAGELDLKNPNNFILFDPNLEWEVKESTFAGAVCNSPLLGQTLKGKIVGTYLGSKWHKVN